MRYYVSPCCPFTQFTTMSSKIIMHNTYVNTGVTQRSRTNLSPIQQFYQNQQHATPSSSSASSNERTIKLISPFHNYLQRPRCTNRALTNKQCLRCHKPYRNLYWDLHQRRLQRRQRRFCHWPPTNPFSPLSDTIHICSPAPTYLCIEDCCV